MTSLITPADHVVVDDLGAACVFALEHWSPAWT
jgi:hypothetical protein